MRLAIRGRKLLEPVPCVAGCGEDVVRKNMRYHLAHECAERHVSCWLCGRGDVPYGPGGRGLRDHVSHLFCSSRLHVLMFVSSFDHLHLIAIDINAINS